MLALFCRLPESLRREMTPWMDAQSEDLQMQSPPDKDASVLQQQIVEHKVCVLGGCSGYVSVTGRTNGLCYLPR